MFRRAKDAALLLDILVDFGRIVAPVERAHLLVPSNQASAGNLAPGTDVSLDQVLARVLVHVDTLAVEPVLASVTCYHESMVVRSTADTVGAAVGLAHPAASSSVLPSDQATRQAAAIIKLIGEICHRRVDLLPGPASSYCCCSLRRGFLDPSARCPCPLGCLDSGRSTPSPRLWWF